MSENINQEQKNPENLILRTVNCLIKTFSEKDNTERLRAETELKDMENDIINHLKNVLLAISEYEKLKLTKESAMSLIIYLKNAIKARLDGKIFEQHVVLEIINIFLEFILSCKISDQLMINVNLIFSDTLNSSYVVKNPKIISDLCDLLQNCIFKNQENLQIFKPVLSVFHIIISSKGVNMEMIFDVLSKMFDPIDFMIGKLVALEKMIDIKAELKTYLEM
jgi:hypothetical protein